MKHAWDSYVQFSWGANELKPVSKRSHSANIFGNTGLGATIIDALDTLHVMGLMDEFKKGRDWVAENLNFEQASEVVIYDVTFDFLFQGDTLSVFEANIRFVGGLLSAYALSKDDV